MTWYTIIYYIVVYAFIIYSALLFIVYTIIGIYGYGAIRKYIRKNRYTDYSLIATSPNAPGFSIIAPAYNEEETIVENVRSMLSLYYNTLEIIIVNDGSRDNTLQKLMLAYELSPVEYLIEGNLETEDVKAVYKSANPVFHKLIVIDKVRGGKADALNVGVNAATMDYVVCIDSDCILEQDAILRLAKPFMDETERKVIACGGIIRIANNCKVVDGKVVDINLPKSWLGRFQTVEYIRAFILGRMAWSRANGLILISGAFGAFDRQIVLEAGGYDRETVGEDMELVVRMRRLMHDKKIKYRVVNIPDPLCWTEIPEDRKILNRQRNRWMRGTMETLHKHRKLFFNPKYGKLGMVSLPYWFFFEFLGPLIEFTGYIAFIIFIILGMVNWPVFWALLAFVITFGILYSIYAILVDNVAYNVYQKRDDIPKQVVAAIAEPLFYHPFIVFAGVGGFKDFLLQEKGWGDMERRGFLYDEELPRWKRMQLGFFAMLKSTMVASLLFIVLYLISAVLEFYFYERTFNEAGTTSELYRLLAENLDFALSVVFISSMLYYVIQYFSISFAKRVIHFIYTFLLLTNILLIKYFSITLNNLGADVFTYSFKEIQLIVGATGAVTFFNTVIAVLVIIMVGMLMAYFLRVPFRSRALPFALLLIGLVSLFVRPSKLMAGGSTFFEDAKSSSKAAYFYESTLDNYVFSPIAQTRLMPQNVREESFNNRKYVDATNYPFLYKDDTKDFLGQYLNVNPTQKPNIVFIVVEGLGSAYSNKNAYLGSYTPFLDELSEKSLFWENALSAAGRTFAALPVLTGSLPFGAGSFMEESAMPANLNLYNMLKKQGYSTGFYYSSDAEFDNMSRYLKANGVDAVVDDDAFEDKHFKIPEVNGYTWGYDDESLLDNYLSKQKMEGPYFNILLTVSMHSPFVVRDKAKYERMFDQQLQKNGFDAKKKEWIRAYRSQLVTVLGFDDAMRAFFTNYSKRPDFNNTIFVITGDHRMPEIPQSTKLDRFHVPLIIYSPMLKEGRKMDNIVSHFDIAPSFVALLRDSYKMPMPEYVTWLGSGLHDGVKYSSQMGIPLKNSKPQLIDFVLGKYHISGNQLFLINRNLDEEKIENPAVFNKLNTQFEAFKKMNTDIYQYKSLVPDSLLTKYTVYKK